MARPDSSRQYKLSDTVNLVVVGLPLGYARQIARREIVNQERKKRAIARPDLRRFPIQLHTVGTFTPILQRFVAEIGFSRIDLGRKIAGRMAQAQGPALPSRDLRQVCAATAVGSACGWMAMSSR